jgi:hypothetical protein
MTCVAFWWAVEPNWLLNNRRFRLCLQTYFLNGLLDATLTQDAYQPTIELRTGTFV